jgi:hypothetical protein
MFKIWLKSRNTVELHSIPQFPPTSASGKCVFWAPSKRVGGGLLICNVEAHIFNVAVEIFRRISRKDSATQPNQNPIEIVGTMALGKRTSAVFSTKLGGKSEVPYNPGFIKGLSECTR